MSKESDNSPKCSNCESTDLGEFLCRNCFENLHEFEDFESIQRFMNELDVLIPENRMFDNVKTLNEHLEMAEEFEARLTSRLSRYQLDRFLEIHEKVKRATSNWLKTRNTNTLDSNFVGLGLVFIGLASFLGLAFTAPGLLALVIPVGLIVYLTNFVSCVGCRKFLFKRRAFMRKTVLDEQYGTHTVHQEIRTSVQNYDSRGKMSGYSSASTYIPHDVEHVDEKAEYVYGCHYCGNIFTKINTRRFNLT